VKKTQNKGYYETVQDRR